jgi:hypothetical protein
MVAIYTVWYNWVRTHKSLRVTPAMAANLTDRLWGWEEIVAGMDAADSPRSAAPIKSAPQRFQTETLPCHGPP